MTAVLHLSTFNFGCSPLWTEVTCQNCGYCMQGFFDDAKDSGLPAGHESLKCLSSKNPRWMGDSQWDNKVIIQSHALHALHEPRAEMLPDMQKQPEL